MIRKGLIDQKTPKSLITQTIEKALTNDWQSRDDLAVKTGLPRHLIVSWSERTKSEFHARLVRPKKNRGQRHYEYRVKIGISEK